MTQADAILRALDQCPIQPLPGLAQDFFLVATPRKSMRAPKTRSRLSVSSALVVALVAAFLQAQGMWSLGRSLTELSAGDREAMTRARGEVLDNMKPGAASSWKDEKTGHLGEAHLLRVYEMNGMTCGEVEHILKIPEARRYVTSFCRTNDGTWRAVF